MKQRGEDEVERLLRENRAEPRAEYVTSLLERLEAQPRRLRTHRLGPRVLVAAAVTALAVGAGAAAGATHVAATSISNLVHVAQSGINGPNQNSNSNGSAHQNNNRRDSAGDGQYTVAICHHTHSATNPWVELFLSPQGAANHLKHHPDDFLVDSNHPCPP